MNWTETREKLLAYGILVERLPEAWEWRVDLTGANLTGADLTGANLREANLRGADLREADLREADLYGADLSEVNLRRANLRRANLVDANLSEADLSWANLYGANLSGANLSGAYLRGAYLIGANLYGADLREAAINWQSHDLIAEILRGAAGDDVPRRMLVGLILISRDWCWEKFLALELDPDLREWALAELRQWVKDGDGAPEALKVAPEAETVSES